MVSASACGEENEVGPMLETMAASMLTDYSPLAPGEKIHFYLKSSIDPVTIFASAFSSGINQAIDSVPEWGQGMEGYGKRFVSSFGQKAADRTVRSGLKILLREDPRYFYSDRRGVGARTLHAIGEIFVSHKDSGGTRPNYSYFAGMASGVYISRQWRPERHRTAEDYITGAAASIGIQSSKNVFMEFWPDIRRKFLKR
jgi:hypothetical protein